MTYHIKLHEIWNYMKYEITWNITFPGMCLYMTYAITWHMIWRDMPYDMPHNIFNDMTNWQMTWNRMIYYKTWHKTLHDIWYDMTWHVDDMYQSLRLTNKHSGAQKLPWWPFKNNFKGSFRCIDGSRGFQRALMKKRVWPG